MVVRELLARLGIQIDEKSISRADRAIEGLKKGLEALAVVEVGKKIFEQFENIASTASDLSHLAEKTGTSVGALQELQYAAKMADVDAGTLQMGLVHLSKSAQDAATLGGLAGAAFHRLGLSVKGSNGHLKPSAQLLSELADKFAKMPDGPEKTAAAQDLLSRSGAEMIPLLNQGSAGLAKYGAEARKAGVVMSAGLIKQGVALDDGLKRLHATLTGLTYAILGPFVGKVGKAAEAIAHWVSAHRKLIALRIDETITAIGNAIRFTVDMAEKFPAAFAGIALALGAIFAPFTTFLTLFALLADDFEVFLSGKGRSVIGLIVKEFKLLGKELGYGFGDDPLAFLYAATNRFTDWFAATVPGRIAKALASSVFANPALAVGDDNAFYRAFGFVSDTLADTARFAPPMTPLLSQAPFAPPPSAPVFNMTFNGMAGDPQEIAGQVRNHVKDALDTHNREAMARVRK